MGEEFITLEDHPNLLADQVEVFLVFGNGLTIQEDIASLDSF
jgi:hypothetical protein